MFLVEHNRTKSFKFRSVIPHEWFSNAVNWNHRLHMIEARSTATSRLSLSCGKPQQHQWFGCKKWSSLWIGSGIINPTLSIISFHVFSLHVFLTCLVRGYLFIFESWKKNIFLVSYTLLIWGGKIYQVVRFFQKIRKNGKSSISSELLEICGHDKYVKCSSWDALSDDNNLVNIWSTFVA